MAPTQNFFSIGEVSKIKGITIKALRFYEKIGLLKPHYIDPVNKYRYYSSEQFIYLDIIKAARTMGISPNDLKVVVVKKDTNELMKFLERQKEKTNQEINELQRVIESINLVQSAIQSSLSSIANQSVYFKEIPPRNIVTIEFSGMSNLEDAMIEYSKLDRIIGAHKLINTYQAGILFQADANFEFHPTQLFNTVQVDENSNLSVVSAIQAGNYLCVCYHKNNAVEQTAKISSYLEQNSLNPSLVLQVELLNDVFFESPGYFELQILV